MADSGGGEPTTTVATATTSSMATVTSTTGSAMTMAGSEQGTNVSPSHRNDKRDYLQKRGSKSRLSKQDEVEEVETEDTSPNSENSDATIVAASGEGEQQGSNVSCAATENTSMGADQNGSESQDHPSLVEQSSTDSSKGSNSKNRLKRSEAISDDTPPPDIQTSRGYGDINPADVAVLQNTYPSCNTLQVSPMPNRRKTGHLSKDSSQGSFNSENGSASGLSRDSSFEAQQYTDTTGTNLEKFIQSTLNKNAKDRSMLLKLEQEFTDFIEKSQEQYLRFPQMTSYHRMLVHRVAAFFGLGHNVDQSGKALVVNKMQNTRIPDFKFSDHLQDIGDEQPKKIILRPHRDYGSLEEGEKGSLDIGKKSRSFEERKENYYKVKNRIWEAPQQEVTQEVSPSRSKDVSGGSSREDVHQWVNQNNPRPWSSTESRESGYGTETGARAKMAASKASSFHGTSSASISRGDSRASTGSMLSSGSRISIPESTRSAESGISNTRYPPTPHSPPLSENQPTSESESSHSMSSPHTEPSFPCFTNEHGQQVAFWVCSTLESIPVGSIIINPTTRQPYVTPDGMPYRWPGVGTRTSPTSLQVPSPSQHPAYTEQRYQDQNQEVSQQQQQLQQQFTQLHMTSHPTHPQHHPQSHHGAGDSAELAPAPPPSHMPPPHPQVPGDGGVAGYQAPPPPTMSQTQQQQYTQGIPQYPFYPGQQPGQAVRYVYQGQPVQLSAQGQISQSEGQIQSQEVTYQGQGYGYPVMGLGQSLTVQSVESHQQMYPPQGVAQPPQGYPPPPQEISTAPQYATQAISGATVSQPVPYVPPGQFYSSNAGPAQVMTFASGPTQVTPFRARTPPSQVGPGGGTYPVISGATQPSPQANLGVAGVAQLATTQQYMSYNTYPTPSTVSVPAPGLSAHPQNRGVTPVLSYTIQPSQPTGYFVRQANIPRSATPPNYTPVAQTQPIKIKDTAEAGKEAESGHAYVASASPMVMSQGVRPTVPFRPVLPVGPGGDARMQGPAYRQLAPPGHFSTELYRPRMPTSAVPTQHVVTPTTSPGSQGQQPPCIHGNGQPASNQNMGVNVVSQTPSNRSMGSNQGQLHGNGSQGQPPRSNAGRQGRRAFAKNGSREGSGGSGSLSTQSSTESMSGSRVFPSGALDTTNAAIVQRSVNAQNGSVALLAEVVSLPPDLPCSQLTSFFHDLTQEGALEAIYLYAEDKNVMKNFSRTLDLILGQKAGQCVARNSDLPVGQAIILVEIKDTLSFDRLVEKFGKNSKYHLKRFSRKLDRNHMISVYQSS